MDPRPNQYQLLLSLQKKVSKEKFLFSPYCLLNSKHYSLLCLTCQYQISFEIWLVTRTGIEPMFAAWEAAVLTAWPTGQMVRLQGFEPGTHWLRVSCSTNWAKGASRQHKLHILRFHLRRKLTHFVVLPLQFRPASLGSELILEIRCSAPWKPNSETNFLRLQAACVFLIAFVGQALGLLVSVSYMPHGTSTSDLSTT